MEINGIKEFLALEDIDVGLFRSCHLWKMPGARSVFGGQVIGQCVLAASRSVPNDFTLHSFHSYFLLATTDATAILYQVDNVRDGKSYCTRNVVAKQGGKPIFSCQLSFHKREETVIQHQYKMPDLLQPDDCFDYHQELQKLYDSKQVPNKYKVIIKKQLDQPRPMQVRLLQRLNLDNILFPKKESKVYMWIKTPQSLNTTENDPIHQCIAAFASDFGLLGSSLRPHGLSSYSPHVKMMATIDHSVWYHAPFSMDEWVLYEMESPRAINNRGYSIGRFFTMSGTLVLSCCQEGVVRISPDFLESNGKL